MIVLLCTSGWCLKVEKILFVFPGSVITMEHREPTREGSANIYILYLQTCGYSALNFFF